MHLTSYIVLSRPLSTVQLVTIPLINAQFTTRHHESVEQEARQLISQRLGVAADTFTVQVQRLDSSDEVLALAG